MSGDDSPALGEQNPFGPDVQKYWDRRKELFSLFDMGIRVDRESLFSIKPEVAALQIAAKIPERSVIDAMCGVGGTAIALARLGKVVVAVDRDERKLEMARHNASIYGVASAIEFIHADAREYLATVPAVGAVYFDPAWGGPDYHLAPSFRLDDFDPPMADLLRASLLKLLSVVITVPNNFDFNELRQFEGEIEIFHSEREGVRLFSTAIIRA
jgi:trimethylguanosine synthase